MEADESDGSEGATELQIFPLPAASNRWFVQEGKTAFGWAEADRKRPAEFLFQQMGNVRGWSVTETWPLTEDGWRKALACLEKEAGPLAARVRVRIAEDEQRRANRALSLAFKEEREAQRSLGSLLGSVILGGYGVGQAIAAGSQVDLHFTEDEIWLTKAKGNIPHLRASYGSAQSFEFTGGIIRAGGGYRGGGFGILGAAEGMAAGALLNQLTTKTKIQTSARVETDSAEVFLFTDQATPSNLTMRFAEVRAKIKAASPSPAAPPAAAAGDDLVEQLSRLGDLFAKGLLSEEEFALAKAQLLRS